MIYLRLLRTFRNSCYDYIITKYEVDIILKDLAAFLFCLITRSWLLVITILIKKNFLMYKSWNPVSSSFFVKTTYHFIRDFNYNFTRANEFFDDIEENLDNGSQLGNAVDERDQET